MKQLKQYRLENALTLVEAAAKVGVHFSTYQKWESGELTPSLKNLRKITNAFGWDYQALVRDLNPEVFATA